MSFLFSRERKWVDLMVGEKVSKEWLGKTNTSRVALAHGEVNPMSCNLVPNDEDGSSFGGEQSKIYLMIYLSK